MGQTLQQDTHTPPAQSVAHHPFSVQSALNDSQKYALVEVMPSAIFTCDRDGLITYFNQRAAELWGRAPKLFDPAERFCGAFQIYRPDGSPIPHDQCPMALAVRTGRSTRDEEIRLLRPDGTSIIVRVNIDPLLDEHGHPAGAINVFEDITPRRQVEEALHISEERLRIATTAGEIGIFDTDLVNHTTYFSPLYRAITKVEREELTLADWLALVHPDDRALVESTVNQAMADGKPYHYEYRIFWPDGTMRWLEVHGVVEMNEQNRAVRITGALRDVTARKQVEERLLALYELRSQVSRNTSPEESYQQAFNALERVLQVDRIAILLADQEGIMRFRASRGLSEHYRQQVEGHSPWARDESNPQPVVIADVAQAHELAGLQPVILGEGIHAVAFIPLVEQGELLGKFMLYYNDSHSFPEAEIQWAQTIASDVAHAIQRRRAEDELRQLNATLEQRVSERTVELERSNRELDQFAYVASHDLKAPLRGIGQLAEWISEDAGDVLPDGSKEHLAKLHGRVKRMDMLLNDLLAYSRAGRQRHSPEKVDTVALVRDVVDMLTPPAGFTVQVPDNLPTLVAERVPLESLFRSLLSNAIKHHHDPQTGHVEIRCHTREGIVEFAITDNGPGIDPVFHGRIFEVFQTLQPRDTVEGSGIGLALVKKLVESRGGTVTVSSNPGQGSTFSFTWPTAAR